MLLKKQTVWLLTMLSLVFVLSVYYFLGNQGEDNQMASNPADVPGINEPAENNGDKNGDEEAAGTDGEDGDKETGANVNEESAEVSYISGDEAFTSARLDLEDIRSGERSELQDQISNTELTAEQISKAQDKLNSLNEIQEKELVLETSIKSRKDVEDALVRVTGEKIRVTIKAKDHTPKLANEIYHIVRGEFTNVRNGDIAFEFTTNNN